MTNRLLSLDVFRGFTIASMIIVNNPGSWEHIFSPLRHVAWHGWTFTDLIFPFFLWIAGVAMTFSFAHRLDRRSDRWGLLQYVFWRALLLFVIGLFLNGFPFGLTASHDFSWATIRIPGVLQRIALCYFLASLIVLYSNTVWQIIWTILLLVGSWVFIKLIPVPGFGAGILEPMGNLAWYIDALLLHGHTWIKAPAPGFDPEGIFSTLTAIATMLSGVLIGQLLQAKRSPSEKTIWMLFLGATFILFGLLMNNWLPINKNLWTTSYAVFTSGIALMIFACCYWLLDVKKWQKYCKPLKIYGLNALPIYVASCLIARLTSFIHVTDAAGTECSLKSYYFNLLFLPLGNPMLASFLHAVVFMLLMYLIAYILYRARIVIKF